MASVDEAYLDMTGTERLHGPPLKAAHTLHQRMKAETRTELLGRNRDISAHRQSFFSVKPSPTECSGSFPARKRSFSLRSTCAKFPASAKSWKRICTRSASRKSAIWPSLEEGELEDRFGKWGLALAGKARGEDAGGWFDSEVGADLDAKSISHEHTYNEDTADVDQLESTLMRLSEMVGRRLRECELPRADGPAQTALQRFHDHHARAHASQTRRNSTPKSSSTSARCSARIGRRGVQVRLLGVHASSFSTQAAIRSI